MTTPKATIIITLEADNTITTESTHKLDKGMASMVWLGMLDVAKMSVMTNIKASKKELAE